MEAVWCDVWLNMPQLSPEHPWREELKCLNYPADKNLWPATWPTTGMLLVNPSFKVRTVFPLFFDPGLPGVKTSHLYNRLKLNKIALYLLYSQSEPNAMTRPCFHFNVLLIGSDNINIMKCSINFMWWCGVGLYKWPQSLEGMFRVSGYQETLC